MNRPGLGGNRRRGLGRDNNPYLAQSNKNNDYGAPESDHEGGIDSDDEITAPLPRLGRGRGRGRGGGGGGRRGGRRGGAGLGRQRPAMSFVSGGVTLKKPKKPKPKITFGDGTTADSIAEGAAAAAAVAAAAAAAAATSTTNPPPPSAPPPVVDAFAELLKSIGTDPEETRREQARKDMLEQERERKTKEEEKAKKVVKMDRNFGRWEHGTKGFGSKILAKFGFEGRLGKNSSGISKPIEVVRRKDGAGLGAVAEASSVNRENNMHLFG